MSVDRRSALEIIATGGAAGLDLHPFLVGHEVIGGGGVRTEGSPASCGCTAGTRS